MREAAKRPGMPRWQSRSIETLAGTLESIQLQAIPVVKKLQELIDDLVESCSKNRDSIMRWLAGLIVLALAIAAWFLGRETSALQWLRMHFDYMAFRLLALACAG